MKEIRNQNTGIVGYIIKHPAENLNLFFFLFKAVADCY